VEVQSRIAQPATSDTLAFLFTDIEGSTRLWERFPAAMQAALARHDAILQAAIETAGGAVVKSTGDGTMAVFRSSTDGVRASLAAQIALGAEPWGETGPLRVRMAVHTGEADRRGDDYFGPTVNRTARIMAAAHGGQVVLSAVAAGLAADRLPDGAAIVDLGEHRLKDLGRPERVFQLVHPSIQRDFPPLVGHGDESAALPGADVDFVGRAAELSEIEGILADPATRLVTLSGPGGTGKTTLAQQVAARHVGRFTDGVRFVELADTADTEGVLIAIARAVGLPESAEQTLADALVESLRPRHLLLVLDNFEQVTVAAATVGRLLADCPRLLVLVTSREVLRIRAERVFPVGPLGLPPESIRHPDPGSIAGFEAIQLFVRRARTVRADFRLTDDNASAVVDLCRRLDGLPLAIELAAARLRMFSPEALRERLGDRLDLLSGTSRDLPARHQTLRATIEWSYRLLEPGEQRLFELMSVFAAADISVVEAVAAAIRSDLAGIDPVDGLSSLLEKSLVREAPTSGGEPRLTMLETIREFATETLDADAARAERARRAHAEHYASFAASRRGELAGSTPEQALAALEHEVGDLRLAWRYFREAGMVDELIGLSGALLILDDARGWYVDALGLATDLLAVIDAAPTRPELLDREIALRLNVARALFAVRGYTPEVTDAFAAALDLFEQAGRPPNHASVLRGLGNLYVLQADFDRGMDIGRRMLELADELGDPAMQVDGNLLTGSMLAFTGHLSEGVDHLGRAIAAFGPETGLARGHLTGNDPRVAVLTTAGFMLWLSGRPDAAIEHSDRAVEMAGRLAHPFTSAYARFHNGLLHLWRLEPALVRDRALTLLEIADEYDFRIWEATGGCLLGAAEVALGRPDDGLARIREGLALYRGLRTPPIFWPMLLQIDAAANLFAGRPETALPSISEGLAIVSSGTGIALLPEFWTLRGDIAAALRSGDEEAQSWYRRAYDMADRLGERMPQLHAAVRLCPIDTAAGHGREAVDRVAEVLAAIEGGDELLDVAAARSLVGDERR
jgi:predicted ATPase/class 3 adenylate cyclase